MTSKLKKIKKFTLSLSKGFTLIETLVAVTVLMVAIVGPYTIASKGLQSSLIAKDQDIAFNLAQDAVEYIRFVRDTNRLSSGNWLTGSGGGVNARDLTVCENAAGCRVDSITDLQSSIVDCSTDPNGVCEPMQYDSSNGYFTYTSGAASIFTRTIQITTPIGGNANEAALTITVSWSDQAGITRSITVREDLFNWQ
jgi:prepilin-type N-terminal cleavage/methylation domain-containing protein